MIEISKQSNQIGLSIKTQEDRIFQKAIQICKEMKGRYEPENRQWLFPTYRLLEILEKLSLVDHLELDYPLRKEMERQISGLSPEAEAILHELSPVLMKHQISGAKFLLQGHSLLLDSLGVGKTRATLASLLVRLKTQQISRFLILCPASVISSWQSEYEICSQQIGLKVPLIFIASSSKMTSYKAKLEEEKSFGCIMTSDLFKRAPEKCQALLNEFKQVNGNIHILDWVIIFDEIHALANPASNISKAIRLVSPTYKIGLTATLLPKNVENVWSPVDWVRPDYLGNYWAFYSRHVVTQDRKIRTPQGPRTIKEKIGYKNLDHLRKQIQEISLRRERHEVLDLPPQIFITRYVSMTKEQQKIYEAVKQQLYDELKGMNADEIYKAIVLFPMVKAIRLLQAANDPSLFGEAGSSIKLEEMERVLEESEEPAIIWTNWQGQMDRLKEHFRDAAVYIDGRTPQNQRASAVARFQAGEVDIFCGNPAAAGEGINLQRATLAIYLDRSYSAVDRIQSLARNYRYGSVNRVTVVDLITRGTIDEIPLRVISQNFETMEKVIRGGDIDKKKLYEELIQAGVVELPKGKV